MGDLSKTSQPNPGEQFTSFWQCGQRRFLMSNVGFYEGFVNNFLGHQNVFPHYDFLFVPDLQQDYRLAVTVPFVDLWFVSVAEHKFRHCMA